MKSFRALHVELDEIHVAIERAYWTFTRCRRSLPHSSVVPHAYNWFIEPAREKLMALCEGRFETAFLSGLEAAEDRRAPSRKAPCACGSGKKAKRCCVP